MDQAFSDRISWTAARVILVRIVNDPHYPMLDEGVRGSIERFIARHPATAIDKTDAG
jgi:hypothetical protein